jgi:glycosyltransferase involved in cell wall biosynthesis
MRPPRFSVIIPLYKQAQFLTDAVQSVLGQTLDDFEVIIVNDASPDNAGEVIAQFTDPRVKSITHEKNKGLPATRNTGMRAASGEFIALLDADDYFHTEKLAVHYAFLEAHPDVDITYNARFDLHHSSRTIRTIYQPPVSVTVKDVLLGFQFSPSDMILRRSCLDDVGLFDEELVCGGEDLDYPCRLALAGKKFARVEKVLNYRRYHSGRKRGKLACRVDDYTNAVNRAVNDPRFPQEYINLRPRALASHYCEVAIWALCQEEYELGNDILGEIQKLDAGLLSGHPTPFVSRLMKHTIRDWNNDHEKELTQVFANLRPQFQGLSEQLPWAITTAYLSRGMREIIWDRSEVGLKHLQAAKQRQAKIEQPFLKQLVAQLLLIRSELGADLAREALERLEEPVRHLGGESSMRYLRGNFAFNSAFELYHAHKYQHVPQELMQAARNWPRFMANKGFYVAMFKSLLSGKSV